MLKSKNINDRLKSGDICVVEFDVGEDHPLYKKQVEAVVDYVSGFYGQDIHAHTTRKQFLPKVPILNKWSRCRKEEEKPVGNSFQIYSGLVSNVIS